MALLGAVSITAAVGFADLAAGGAGMARALFYFFAIVCIGLLLYQFLTFTPRLRASLDAGDD